MGSQLRMKTQADPHLTRFRVFEPPATDSRMKVVSSRHLHATHPLDAMMPKRQV